MSKADRDNVPRGAAARFGGVTACFARERWPDDHMGLDSGRRAEVLMQKILATLRAIDKSTSRQDGLRQQLEVNEAFLAFAACADGVACQHNSSGKSSSERAMKTQLRMWDAMAEELTAHRDQLDSALHGMRKMEPAMGKGDELTVASCEVLSRLLSGESNLESKELRQASSMLPAQGIGFPEVNWQQEQEEPKNTGSLPPAAAAALCEPPAAAPQAASATMVSSARVPQPRAEVKASPIQWPLLQQQSPSCASSSPSPGLAPAMRNATQSGLLSASLVPPEEELHSTYLLAIGAASAAVRPAPAGPAASTAALEGAGFKSLVTPAALKYAQRS